MPLTVLRYILPHDWVLTTFSYLRLEDQAGLFEMKVKCSLQGAETGDELKSEITGQGAAAVTSLEGTGLEHGASVIRGQPLLN